MNRIIIACAVFSFAAVAVIPDENQAQIVNYKNENDGTGNYKFSYETSNGLKRKETGRWVNAGRDDEHLVVEGSYSYTDVDGDRVIVRYTADENGYHLLPVPPTTIKLASYLSPNVVASLLGK